MDLIDKNHIDFTKLITDELIIKSQFIEISIGRLVKNIFKKAEIMDTMIQESNFLINFINHTHIF